MGLPIIIWELTQNPRLPTSLATNPVTQYDSQTQITFLLRGELVETKLLKYHSALETFICTDRSCRTFLPEDGDQNCFTPYPQHSMY